MAQRLATEYVKATLKLSEPQMQQFLRMAEDGHVLQRVKVLGNGGQDIVLEDGAGEEVHFPFGRKDGFYVCELSCRLVNLQLTNMVRKLFLAFKGEGIVNRVYAGFTMMYVYSNGSVRKIIEVRDGSARVVYQHKNTAHEFEQLYHSRDIEQKILQVKNSVNQLLDARNKSLCKAEIDRIDEQLRLESFVLFTLEA
ncbi:non-ribosomal peptide synthetase module [Neobacillus mesonae]|nr:non-ribosomal peptide synthetase module [Neobacillus mesonae]